VTWSPEAQSAPRSLRICNPCICNPWSGITKPSSKHQARPWTNSVEVKKAREGSFSRAWNRSLATTHPLFKATSLGTNLGASSCKKAPK